MMPGMRGGVSRRWLAPLGLVALFFAYQLPEGLGQRALGSSLAQGLLMLAVLPFAWLVGRALGSRGFHAYALDAGTGSAAWLACGLLAALVMKAVAVLFGLQLGIYASAAASAPKGIGAWAGLFFQAPS
jgi:hypothetical protein